MNRDNRRYVNMEVKSDLYRSALALNNAAVRMRITHASTPAEHLALGVYNALKKAADDAYDLARIPYADACHSQMGAVIRDVEVLSYIVSKNFNDCNFLPQRVIDDIDHAKFSLFLAETFLGSAFCTLTLMV